MIKRLENLLFVIIIMLATIFLSKKIYSQNISKNEISLWPKMAPGSESVQLQQKIFDRSDKPNIKARAINGITQPSIIPMLPDNKNQKPAVLICPGGGYERVVIDKEGFDIARWLNSIGYAAFVLKYRLPGEGHEEQHNVPLQDGRRAIRIIRENAEQWNINPKKVGAIGFSAGGHLVSTLGTRDSIMAYNKIDSSDRLSGKPDFMMLIYPVISMKKEYTHAGSRRRLLGDSPSMELVKKFSGELNVDSTSPPSFLVHANNDRVSPLNSSRFYNALKKSNNETELHIFNKGGHGFGIRNAEGAIRSWTKLAEKWLRSLEE